MELFRRLRNPEAKAISSLFRSPPKENVVSSKLIESSTLDVITRTVTDMASHRSTTADGVVIPKTATHPIAGASDAKSMSTPQTTGSNRNVNDRGPIPAPPDSPPIRSRPETPGEIYTPPNYWPSQLSRQDPGSKRTECWGVSVCDIVTPRVSNKYSQHSGQSSQESASTEPMPHRRQQLSKTMAITTTSSPSNSGVNTNIRPSLNSYKLSARRMDDPTVSCKRNSKKNGRAPVRKQRQEPSKVTRANSRSRGDRQVVEESSSVKPSSGENPKSLTFSGENQQWRQLRRRNSEPACGTHPRPQATNSRRPLEGNIGTKLKQSASSSSRGTSSRKRPSSASRLKHLSRMSANEIDDRAPFLRPPLLGCSDFIGELDQKSPPAGHLGSVETDCLNTLQGSALKETLSHPDPEQTSQAIGDVPSTINVTSSCDGVHASCIRSGEIVLDLIDTEKPVGRGRPSTASSPPGRGSGRSGSDAPTRSRRCRGSSCRGGDDDASLVGGRSRTPTMSQPLPSGTSSTEAATAKRPARMSAPPVTKHKKGNTLSIKKALEAADLNLDMAAYIDARPIFQSSTSLKAFSRGLNPTGTQTATTINNDRNAVKQGFHRSSSLQMVDATTAENECAVRERPQSSMEFSHSGLPVDYHQSPLETHVMFEIGSSTSDISPVNAPAPNAEQQPTSKLDRVRDLLNRIPSSSGSSSNTGGLFTRRPSFTVGLKRRPSTN